MHNLSDQGMFMPSEVDHSYIANEYRNRVKEIEALKAEVIRLENQIKFDQDYSYQGDESLNKITTAAKESYLKSQSCARGQIITTADNFDNHIIWASIAYTRKHEVDALKAELLAARDAAVKASCETSVGCYGSVEIILDNSIERIEKFLNKDKGRG